MPLRHKSAQKRARQRTGRTQRNKFYKSQLKSAVRRVREAKDKSTGEKELKTAVALVDRVASKGIIHKNNAANKKSRLVRFVSKLS